MLYSIQTVFKSKRSWIMSLVIKKTQVSDKSKEIEEAKAIAKSLRAKKNPFVEEISKEDKESMQTFIRTLYNNK